MSPNNPVIPVCTVASRCALDVKGAGGGIASANCSWKRTRFAGGTGLAASAVAADEGEGGPSEVGWGGCTSWVP